MDYNMANEQPTIGHRSSPVQGWAKGGDAEVISLALHCGNTKWKSARASGTVDCWWACDL